MTNKIHNSSLDLSLTKEDLSDYIIQQSYNIFPDKKIEKNNTYYDSIKNALERYKKCAFHLKSKYFNHNGNIFFNHLNTDNYATFLYFLSNSLYRDNQIDLASRVYYLNKVLNNLDVFYEVELPEIFLFGHPLGTVLGRANYSNYIVFSQNCTIGNNNGYYPSFEEGVVLYGGSSVVGESCIGPNSHISAQCFVRNFNVEGNCVVYGSGNAVNTKPTQNSVKEIYFSNYE